MTRQRLLDRQNRLLEHLTDPALFADNPGGGEAAHPDLAGIDIARLRLVGAMSLGKRIEKIRSALPRTFEYLVHDPAVSAADFGHRFPPTSITRHHNAAQFHDYLRQLWRTRPAEPPFLPDLAGLEVAIAKVGAVEAAGDVDDVGEGRGVRRRAGVELVRCRFDVRPLFDDTAERAPPAQRDTCLAVTLTEDGTSPRVFELPPDIHDDLAALDGWRRRADFAPGQDDAGALIAALTERNILEVRE